MPFIDQAKTNSADVYRGTVLIGKITRTKSGSVFTYHSQFLESLGSEEKEEKGAAFHLPYSRQKTETAGINLHPYFAGLLPEGLRLKALIQKVKTSEDDLLSLLISSGANCIGDLSVLPEGAPFLAHSTLADLGKLNEVVFSELFKKSISPESDLNDLDEVNIPGVQDKISASMISFPLGGRAGHKSYILKLEPVDKPRLVQNEYFFLQMAKACGLQVNPAKLVKDKTGKEGLLVERFDRLSQKDTGELISLHQEDGCQFLNLYPADKYRIPFSKIAEGLNLCSTPLLEVGKLLRLKAFCYLIANGDLHARNVSILTSPKTGRSELTPAYDILSTLPYGDQRLALKFEGRDDNLKRKNFIDFGKRFGVREVVTQDLLDQIYEDSPGWIDRLEEIGLGEKKTTHLRTVMLKRRTDLA